MISLGYALFVSGHYSRHTGILMGILDLIVEGFAFYLVFTSQC